MEAHLDGCDGKRTFVGPAKAGTHNHRRLWLRKVSTNVPNTNGTAYGSRLSPGRRKMMQTVKQQTHIRVLAAQCARGVDESSAQRGRGERRMPLAPAASCALGSGRTHTSNNEYPESPGVPARNGFNGFLRALPGDRALLPPSPTDMFCLSPVGPTRLRELDASVGASGPHDFAVRCNVSRPLAVDRSQAFRQPALQSRRAQNAAASTASAPRVRDDRDTPLWWDGMREVLDMIW